MTKGNLASWKKKEGDHVKTGDVLAEVETDKAKVDFEILDAGYLAKILVPEGTNDVEVGKIVAVIVDSKEEVAAIQALDASTWGASAAAPTPAPAAPTPAAPTPAPAAPTPAAPTPAKAQNIPSTGDRSISSPLARRVR